MGSRENRIILVCIAAALLLAFAPPLAGIAGVPLGVEYPYWLFWAILVGVGVVLPSLWLGYVEGSGGRIS
ncbi:hypothetical protein [Halorarius litoreus]|uniref:hypothetical protein n=1 Tax=Halorarius litoreus TaxID=2962676 RepID=UPI0020CC68EE|nr:hypothetical protein [Halorarius litoreus]